MSLVEKPKGEPFDNGNKRSDGQYERYAVLPQSERDKGFVRPLRHSYRHLICDTVTTMGYALAATYARDPKYYGATFCCACRDHFLVADFVWEGTNEAVGS
jgi:hypothetical protein